VLLKVELKVKLEGFESVDRWLSRLDEGWRDRARGILMNFVDWLGGNSTKFGSYTPDMLIEYQRESDNGSRYDILDEIQRYVQGFDIRYNSKVKYYSTLRAFFAHNRVELPSDPRFQLRSDIPKVEGELPIEELRDLLFACNECYRAIFLSMFQGGMDQASFVYWNENGWEKLEKELRDKEVRVIRVDIAGRKRGKNITPFYTLIGRDAIDAIRNWIKIRPPDAGAIFTNQFGRPITKSGLYMLWRRTLIRLGYIDRPNEEEPVWSGKGPHEMRDTFRSMWEKSPAKASISEFLMGHQVDPLEYNKAFRDEDWVRGEYEKALPYLNVLSSGKPYKLVDEGELETLRNEVARLRTERENYRDLEVKVNKMEKAMRIFFNDPDLLKKIKDEIDPST